MTKHTVLQDKKLSTAQINDGEWQAEHFLGIWYATSWQTFPRKVNLIQDAYFIKTSLGLDAIFHNY